MRIYRTGIKSCANAFQRRSFEVLNYHPSIGVIPRSDAESRTARILNNLGMGISDPSVRENRHLNGLGVLEDYRILIQPTM